MKKPSELYVISEPEPEPAETGFVGPPWPSPGVWEAFMRRWKNQISGWQPKPVEKPAPALKG